MRDRRRPSGSLGNRRVEAVERHRHEVVKPDGEGWPGVALMGRNRPAAPRRTPRPERPPPPKLSAGCRPMAGVSARISGKMVVVVDENKFCRRVCAPAPQDEIEGLGRGASGEGADEERRITFCYESSREYLSAGFTASDHFVAPSAGGEVVWGHAEGRERVGVSCVEDRANIGVVGEKHGRLKRADLIGFPQRGRRRQRSVERRRSLRIEAASIEFGAAPRQRVFGVNGIEGAIEQADVMARRFQA
jgi:hypothetical protein